MTPVERVLQIAKAEVGYVEGGPGHAGNVTKYWAELDAKLQGQPWCGAYVSWVFKHAQVPLPAIDKPYGYVYCPDAVRWASAHARRSMTPSVGAIALYGSNGLAVHTGIVSSVSRNGRDFMAFEGNTEVGNDTNGGMVMERQRNVSWVVCFLLPDYAAWDAAPTPLRPQESITHMPAVTMEPIVATLFTADGKGVWHFAASGAEYAFGNAESRVAKWNRAKDFAGRTVDHVELGTDGVHPYVMVATSGERYAP